MEKIIGKIINFPGCDKEFIYTLVDGVFVSEMTMEMLAENIADPWSQADEKYIIKVNCKDGYTEIPEGTPTFVCEYTVMGYECMITSIYGYGNSPEDALKDCIELFNKLQEEYNGEAED